MDYCDNQVTSTINKLIASTLFQLKIAVFYNRKKHTNEPFPFLNGKFQSQSSHVSLQAARNLLCELQYEEYFGQVLNKSPQSTKQIIKNEL